MTLSIAIPIHRRAVQALFLALATLVAAAPVLAADTVYLEYSNSGLEDLGPGWVYEGWLIIDEAPVSTGTFTVTSPGTTTPSRSRVYVSDAAAVTTFVVTIEPVPDMDPGPSAVHVLAGDFSGSAAHLTAGHAAALGDDFSSAAATYILNAPSGGDMAVYGNGIWWLDPTTGPGPTLELPTLPDGWAYEGWVVGSDGPVSTGYFTDATMTDSDGAGITSGPFGAPPLPGQDFVVPPTDLTMGHAAVISIEPMPDNSTAPFTFKPLVDGSIEDLGAGIPQAMDNNSATFPTLHVVMNTADTTETAHLMLSFNGLEDLGDDAAYEGWLIVDGAPVSTGIFTVAGGVASATYFPTEVSSLHAISAFVLTIEPSPDSDPAPNVTHLVGGDMIDGQAALTIGHETSLGTDFTDASGTYILNAPSSGGSASYTNGIWWLDPATGPGPTLTLPELPAGWVYEGWVASADGPISTGRFSMASGEDSDGAGPTSGSEAFPPFPGQDFVDPAIDLTSGFAAIISVEPEPDNSAAPFTLKPLMDPKVDDVGAGIMQPMHLNLGAVPWGSAKLANVVTFPAAASSDGVGGVRWETDIDFANDGPATAVRIQLLRSNHANPVPETATLSLPAGSAVRTMQVLDSIFDYDGSGALRIVTRSDHVRTTSRTYADTAAGSYGQGIPAMAARHALAYGDTGRLLGLSESDRFRTNIGFVNPNLAEVVIELELFAADGSLVSTTSVTLSANEHRQLNAVFGETVDAGWARVWTSTPGGSFFAYGSVVDNGVDDPTFIMVR